MAARGFLGAGDIYINRKVAGVAQGLAGPFYANKFEIKPNVETKELISKGRNTYGQTIESVAIQQPADFTLELNEVNTESLVLAFLGTATDVSQASGSLSNVPYTVKKGKWISLGFEAIADAGFAVRHVSDTPVYVEGTDYIVNRPLGLLKILDTSAIVDGATVEVAATYAAVASTKIAGATNSDVRAEIIFDGINQADGLPVKVTVWEAIVAADSAFDFLADDFNTVNLPGKMKTPAGKTEPFEVVLRKAA